MMHGVYGLDILCRWDMPDGMSFGRQYTVASDFKGAGEEWHPRGNSHYKLSEFQ